MWIIIPNQISFKRLCNLQETALICNTVSHSTLSLPDFLPVWCSTIIRVQLMEAEAYLHLHQSRCPVRSPRQMCSGRTPLRAGWRTRTPCLLCQTRVLQHLDSHLSASRKCCSDEFDLRGLTRAANEGQSRDLTLRTRNKDCFMLYTGSSVLG